MEQTKLQEKKETLHVEEQKLQHPSLNTVRPSYRGRLLSTHLLPHMMLQMEKAKIEDHRWKSIAIEKGVGKVTKLEDDLDKLREEMMILKIKEANKRKYLEKKNKHSDSSWGRLRHQIQLVITKL